jgi:hypothetical protein
MKRIFVGLVISLLVLFYPMAAYAATDPGSTTNDATSATQTTGPTSPTGADANTYHFNPDTGNWENDHYIWNPNTGQTTPKDTPTYTYNESTGTYDTTQWKYNAASGQYDAVPETVTQPPADAKTVGAPATTTIDNTATTGLNNTVNSTAATGDAIVSGNTLAGDATTGNANVTANIINLLQSSLGNVGNTGGVVTFMANIPGDVNGNLMIDPAAIAQTQGTVQLQDAQAVTVHNQNDGQINNAIILNASSGNAGVIANTTGGNATSGNADALANVVNVMNSSIAAGQSFIGAVNIQGDLTGDILFPTGFLDSLIANNTTATADINNTNNQTINNNVTANASTGTATVDHNTDAGSATSGNALNKITVMNLTGSDIIGNNALLVFVNVGGTWTGLLMNGPASNSAMLGGGISQDTSVSRQLTATNTNNQGITNNITANANTGDATVSGNTQAGNATSGNATTTVNLTNILDSHISLANWFGILFINILGNWNGSLASAPATSNNTAASGGSTNGGNTPAVFSFIPAGSTGGHGPIISTTVSHGSNGSSDTSSDTPPLVELASHHSGPGQVLGSAATAAKQAAKTSSHYNFWFPAVGLLFGVLILGSDRLVGFLRRS